MNFSISLGSGEIGLTLQAQIIDSTGSPVGGPISSGFVEVGGGSYFWSYNIANTFSGGVVFQDTTNPAIAALADINPLQEVILDPTALDSIIIDNGINARQALEAIAAAVAGVLQITAPNTLTIEAIGGGPTRIVARVSSLGERETVTLTL